MLSRRPIICTLVTAFALVISCAALAPIAAADTLGLRPLADGPIYLGTAPLEVETCGTTITVKNFAEDPLVLFGVAVPASDAWGYAKVSLSNPDVPYPTVDPGDTLDLAVCFLGRTPGVHQLELQLFDQTPAEFPNGVHRGSWPIWFNITGTLPSVTTLVGPSSTLPGTDVTLTGTVEDHWSPLRGVGVAISRNDATGTTPLPAVTTDSNGAFSLLAPVADSDATFTATFVDANHDPSTATWTVKAVKSISVLTLLAPTTGSRGVQYTVTGMLVSGGAPVASARLTVTRKDLAGSRSFDAFTTAEGSFAFSDLPGVGGPVTFTATWPGDAQRTATTAVRTVTIARAATALTIKSSATRYAYGARATITVHLGTSYNSRYVTVYARPLGTSVTAPGTRLVTAKVNSLGNLTVTYVMKRKTTFTAVFLGDYRYSGATRAVSPTVVSRVTLTMTGYTGTSNGAYLYRHGTEVDFRSTVAPARPGGCEAFVVQAYRSGRWVTVASTSCGELDGRSTAYMYFQSTAPSGARFRVRGSVVANGYSAAGVSPWRYFTYT